MSRQKSLSLIFTLALSWYGCGDGGGDTGNTFTPVVGGDSGAFTPGALGGTTPSTLGGTTPSTLGGTTPSTLGGTTPSTLGGTTPGAGGTTAGTVDAGLGGFPGGDAGSHRDAAVMVSDSGPPAMMGKGDCCPDGNCLCHGPVATKLSAAKGSFKTATLAMSTGTLFYPTDAQPPFAGIAICPGFLNSGPEMNDWGTFYASWGIVTLVTDTFPTDFPDTRGDLLLGSVEAMKKENSKSGSPLNGKMTDRYGTSGYSMGGGGTVIAAAKTPSLKSSVGLAAWGPVNEAQVKVPTLLFCGTADAVAPCSDHSDPAYAAIPNTTPKMKIVIDGAEHLASWFGPADGGGGVSGGWALAFEKVYLEGDTRWKTLLLGKPAGSTMTTNIMP